MTRMTATQTVINENENKITIATTGTITTSCALTARVFRFRKSKYYCKMSREEKVETGRIGAVNGSCKTNYNY